MKWYQKVLPVHAVVVAAFCYALMPSAALAAEADTTWPARPLEMSIVFSPGGALDVTARVLAQEAEAILGQTIIPANNPGGGGIPGLTLLARSAPDGYHLGACVSNSLIFVPHRNATPYKPLADMEPILSFGQAAPVLVTAANAPWAEVDAFLAATREKKGAMRIGVPGLGSPSHIVLSMISKQDSSLTWRFVPFSGPGEAEAALLGGHVDAAASGALPRIKGGQLKPLMALAAERLPGLPDTPGLSEKGFADPGRGDSTFLLLVPTGTPEGVMAKLEEAFLKAAGSEAFRKATESFSVVPVIRGRADAKAFLREVWHEESGILAATGLSDQPATAPE